MWYVYVKNGIYKGKEDDHPGNVLTGASLSTAVTVTMVEPTGDWSPTGRLNKSVLVKNGAELRTTVTTIVAVAVRGVGLLSRAVTYSCNKTSLCVRGKSSSNTLNLELETNKAVVMNCPISSDFLASCALHCW